MLCKLLLFLFSLLPVPYLLGSLLSGLFALKSGQKAHPFYRLLFGLFAEFALFEILAIPMVFARCSLTLLTRCWLLLLAVLMGLLLLYRKKKTGRFFGSLSLPLPQKFHPMLLLLVCSILFQIGYVTFRQHVDEDDAFYVATAVTAIETDTLMEYNPYTGALYKTIPSRYVLASWPLYLAVLARTTGIHPTLLAHLLLPGLLLLFAYLVYALLARQFYPEPGKRWTFLFFVTVVLGFSGFSVYSSGTFLLIRTWQGKALVAGLIQPALFYCCKEAMDARFSSNHGSDIWLFLFCVVASACMFSSMGVVLTLVPVGVYALLYSFKSRNPRLLLSSLLSCFPAFLCGVLYLFLS